MFEACGAKIRASNPTQLLRPHARRMQGLDVYKRQVYEVTKALYGEAAQKQLANGHAKGKFITKENAVRSAGIPFHAGAERFYKEAGLLK